MATRFKRSEQIRLADGRHATLSAVQLTDDEFEVMLLPSGGDGEEIVSRRCSSIGEAICFFEDIRERYHIPELTGQYKKLADDLKAALTYGLEHMGTDDGGTCNFDAPAVSLPGWDKRLVEAAARIAGVGCFEWNLWGVSSYVFSVPGAGQGYTRTNAAEAMSRYLKERGYDAGMYYRMD